MSRVCVAIIVAQFLAALPSLAVAGEKIDFTGDIEPILQQHCIRCHGVDERNGGLSFEDKASLFAEADSGGRAIVVGEPDSSSVSISAIHLIAIELVPSNLRKLMREAVVIWLKRAGREAVKTASARSPGWSEDERRESSGTRGLRAHGSRRRAIDSQTQSIQPSRSPTGASC